MRSVNFILWTLIFLGFSGSVKQESEDENVTVKRKGLKRKRIKDEPKDEPIEEPSVSTASPT